MQCQIKNWLVFGPGAHKDGSAFYSPNRCRQIADNFARFSKRLPVPLRLGHDRSQRFAKSLGFGNIGTVTRLTAMSDGSLVADVEGVPLEIAQEINAGRLNSGSVELLDGVRDPDNAAVKIPGDLLTGLALLGEERPSVWNYNADVADRSRPRATFADGRPVPPATSAGRWLTAMADVVKGESDGRYSALAFSASYQAQSVRFSSLKPLTPGGSAMPAAAGYAPPGAPAAPPQQFADLTPEAVKAALEAAGCTPDVIAKVMQMIAGGAAPSTEMLSDAADLADAEREVAEKRQAFASKYAGGGYGTRPLSAFQRAMLHPDGVLARNSPALARRLRERGAV